MTDKEFKHLKRSELLEIIHEYQKREQDMQAEIESLKNELQTKDLKISESTAISDAISKLDTVMASALQTTDHYLEQVRTFCAESEKKAAEMIEAAKREAAEIQEQVILPNPKHESGEPKT